MVFLIDTNKDTHSHYKRHLSIRFRPKLVTIEIIFDFCRNYEIHTLEPIKIIPNVDFNFESRNIKFNSSTSSP
jgi:hypothetical protein